MGFAQIGFSQFEQVNGDDSVKRRRRVDEVNGFSSQFAALMERWARQ
jgi:hypothetical protein